MSTNTRYRTQTIDYLGFLQTQLRDLRGISTLAYELIQNADDVRDDQGRPAASRITFDICDDTLIVENDGIFREVDFDRVSRIASGGKREEKGTTGAFGIGFISVYQITDCPEILSSGQHWRIRPHVADERKRIEIIDSEIEGTQFRLPWAFESDSEVRRALRIEPVHQSQFDDFQREIAQALSLASLFLKQLKVLELRRSGRLIKRVEREPEEDDHLLIQDGDQTQIWRIFCGNFDNEARRLRDQYPSQIEDKRLSNILVAIPDEPLTSGRLFAVLPTETVVPLPFHLNADFFPTNDRKHIIFGNDYQSDWNRAAVRAAARTLSANFDKLRDLLGHKGAWQVLRRLDDCRRQVERNEYDPVFAAFWEEIAPSLRTRNIVFTTTSQWVTPEEVRLLESDVEETASPILENLNIPIVHPDLRPYFNLLRQKEIGTPLLKVTDIVEALSDAGLDKRTELNQAPSALRTVEQWQTFWQAIDTLLDRSQQTSDERSRSRNALRQCAIAFGPDDTLWSPAQLFRADAETQELFPKVPWLATVCEPEQVPHSLVQEFTASEAIAFLENTSKDALQDAWRNGLLNLASLYQWFEARKPQIQSDSQLKKRLCNLPVWPSSQQLGPLTDLYIPGGFDDPLKLSVLVDLEALGGRKEFLRDLGLQELTFATYVREQVPRVFEENIDLLSPTDRQQLVYLFAQRLGEFRDDQKLKERLKKLPLVECVDDVFRSATTVYTHANVATILGSHIHVVKPVKQNSDAIKALYEWLEVAQHPRPTDIINRLRELVTQPPNRAAHQTVEAVFGYLAEEWGKWEDSQRNQYDALKQLAWLPSNKDDTLWYKPQQLYAVFQDYLFETQVPFLIIPRQLQNRAGTTGLIDFLEINTKPTPPLVVRHLQEYSRQNRPVNREVYRFLNDNADDPAVADLNGTACLLLPDSRYVRPDQVFWGEHPFGSYRYQLGSELRQYHSLFDRLGVRERPEDRDFIIVLLEISQNYTRNHAPLDKQSLDIVIHCWKELSAALDQERLSSDELRRLKDHPVIPNNQRILTQPELIFFEDRAGLAAKFPQFLENDVIARPQGAWRAMSKVGVRLLGDAVDLHVLEREGDVDDEGLSALVQERCHLLNRVIESEKPSAPDGLNPNILETLHFRKVRKLLINYSLQAFKQKRTTDPESVPALYLKDEASFITVYENGAISWPAAAREMANAIKPIGEIGGLAGGIKEVLSSTSPQEAERSLDELGYPPLQEHFQTEVEPGTIIQGLGGEVPTKEGAIDSFVGDAGLPETPARVEVVPQTVTRDDTADAAPSGKTTGSTSIKGPTGPSSATTTTGSETSAKDGRPLITIETDIDVSERKPPIKHVPSGRLRTYVIPQSGDIPSTSDPDGYERRTTMGQIGVKRVLVYETECGRTARDTNETHPNHPGYDVESTDVEGDVRYIEVKSMEGSWSPRTPASVTQAQFKKAQELRDRFWLYVVEFAPDDEQYRVFPIQDPFGKVNQYLFDDGWQELAEADEQLAAPEA